MMFNVECFCLPLADVAAAAVGVGVGVGIGVGVGVGVVLMENRKQNVVLCGRFDFFCSPDILHYERYLEIGVGLKCFYVAISDFYIWSKLGVKKCADQNATDDAREPRTLRPDAYHQTNVDGPIRSDPIRSDSSRQEYSSFPFHFFCPYQAMCKHRHTQTNTQNIPLHDWRSGLGFLFFSCTLDSHLRLIYFVGGGGGGGSH
ncbi:hypothetical protein BLOT_011280 [Blomia tropicalis]|nr:hypothetical protein BLOT_011280 [Blomia tropicalis]